MATVDTIDLKDLGPYLNGLVDRMSLKHPEKALKACAINLGNELKRMMQKGVSPDGTAYKPLKFPRPNGKSHPLWDTGALARSTAGGVNHVQRITGSTLEVGTNIEYAATHQFGATIKPKKGKFLAIPLTMAAKRAGSPRNFPTPLKPIIGKKGGVLVGKGKKKGVAGMMAAQYALVKSVTIPPRPFIGFSPKMISDTAAILAKHAIGA